MELRDTLNTCNGYIEIIEKNSSYIEKKLKKISSLEEDESMRVKRFPRDNKDIIKSTYGTIFKYLFDILNAKYSKGDNIEDLKEIAVSCISYLQKSWEAENNYVQMVNMLSICIILDIENIEFEKLVDLVDKSTTKDFLIDFLINYRKSNRPISTTFLWKKPYESIKEIVDLASENKGLCISRLSVYLAKEWYKNYDAKDTHKSEWNIHTGYWSYESGAIVKILGLNDASLKGIQYYPYDMNRYLKRE
ncbi:PoNe immunity protein domain-containing protein [Tenacibaculum agarivorans]|uniref:PoNe immunity protein domain-containing protein n=1 Tax=Tenacibaculum agarivorans TaxID=1908389 RepID=UPI00094BB7D0|nr:PoNe immunity protein domain-containing protein [Tenacibaculum agarivorans]